MTREEIIKSEKAMGGMYAVTPSVVLLDDALPISAKMLYGIIVWSCNQYAYTWASNRTLGAYLGLSGKRTAELIRALEEQGHIETEVVRDTETNQVTARYIYPIVKSGRSLRHDKGTPPPKNKGRSPEEAMEEAYPSPEISEDPSPEKSGVKDQNIKIIPPYNPPTGDEAGETEPKEKTKKPSPYELAEDAKPLLRAYVGEDRELAQALADLIESRKELKARNTARAIKALLKELEQYSGGIRANKLALINKAIAAQWKSIYPMRAGEFPESVPPSTQKDKQPEPKFVGFEIIDGERVAVYE